MIKFTYVKVNSRIHNLNPIVKIVWLTCVNLFSILVWDIAWLSIFFLSIFLVGLMANLGLKRLLDAIRILKPLITILFFSPILMLLPEFREISPYSSPIMLIIEGFAFGATVTLRFCCIIYSSLIFIMTTRLKDLAHMLVKLGLPYRYAYMLITAFRLIPSIEKNANNVRFAQMARGLKLEDTTGLVKYLNFIKYTVKPVLISSLRGSLFLAISMDSSCFGAYDKRVFLDDIVFSKTDMVISILILLVLTVGVFLLSVGKFPILLDLSETIRRLFLPSGGIL